jgi:hypothetical protein
MKDQNAMRTWIPLAVLVLGMVPTSAFGQLYLIAGAPTPKGFGGFDTKLFEVNRSGEVALVADLATSQVGTEWIAVAYDLRKAVVLPKDSRKPVIVIDLDKAAVVKQCVLPQVKGDASLIEQWVANVPGKGPMFEWYSARNLQEVWLQGMILDPSISCEESFPTVSATDFTHIEAYGTAGVAEVGSGDGTYIAITQDGKLSKLLAQTAVDFDSNALPAAIRKDASFSGITASWSP